MGRSRAQQNALLGQLWKCLAACVKAKTKGVRVEANQQHPIDLRIEGTIGGKLISDAVVGLFTVGGPGVRSKPTAAPKLDLVGNLLAAIDEPKRSRVYERLLKSFRDHGALPTLPAGAKAAAEKLIAELTRSEQVGTAPSCSFKAASGDGQK